jgi:hypothetical protein
LPATRIILYAGESRDKLPKFEPPGAATWAWDLPWDMGNTMLDNGLQKKTFYCPGTASRFDDNLNFLNTADGTSLWNYTLNSLHVAGYCFAFSGSLSKSYDANQNKTLQPETITNPLLGTSTIVPVTDRILTADATLSTDNSRGANGGYLDANRNNYIYNNVLGDFPKTGAKVPHLSPHLKGSKPAGGNVGFKDGHVQWRNFADMNQRVDPNKAAGTPAFWW